MSGQNLTTFGFRASCNFEPESGLEQAISFPLPCVQRHGEEEPYVTNGACGLCRGQQASKEPGAPPLYPDAFFSEKSDMKGCYCILGFPPSIGRPCVKTRGPKPLVTVDWQLRSVHVVDPCVEILAPVSCARCHTPLVGSQELENAHIVTSFPTPRKSSQHSLFLLPVQIENTF
jgi:hypothetical protein